MVSVHQSVAGQWALGGLIKSITSLGASLGCITFLVLQWGALLFLVLPDVLVNNCFEVSLMSLRTWSSTNALRPSWCMVNGVWCMMLHVTGFTSLSIELALSSPALMTNSNISKWMRKSFGSMEQDVAFVVLCRSGVGNLRPAGQLRPAELFHAARGLTVRLCMTPPAPAILIYKIKNSTSCLD